MSKLLPYALVLAGILLGFWALKAVADDDYFQYQRGYD